MMKDADEGDLKCLTLQVLIPRILKATLTGNRKKIHSLSSYQLPTQKKTKLLTFKMLHSSKELIALSWEKLNGRPPGLPTSEPSQA